MNKVFKFYNDASHGWLGVKRQLLEELGLINAISAHSYIKGKTVYLEEDADMTLFANAYQQAHGTFETVSIDHGTRSFIRNYDQFLTSSNTTLIEVGVPKVDQTTVYTDTLSQK